MGSSPNLSDPLPQHQILDLEPNNKRLKKNTMIDDENQQNTILPEEIVLEFLYRVPVKPLLRFGVVCKHWYNSINQDPNFISSHFIEYSQKHPRLILNFLNRNKNNNNNNCNHVEYFHSFFDLGEVKINQSVNVVDVNQNLASDIKCKVDLVGYCNGLICLSERCPVISKVWIWNTARNESLFIHPPIDDSDDGAYGVLNYGFGFDSIRKEYKVVYIIYSAKVSFFKCLVLTLGCGTISWKEVMIPKVRVSRDYKSAVFASNNGASTLFWRTVDINVLLSFDLHEDTFNIIRVPVECKSTKDEYPLVWPVEFRGFLGLLRLESLIPRGHPVHEEGNTWKMVHLYILQDRVNKVWNKQTFDLTPYSLPCCMNARFASFSYQILLFWFDGKCFQFFNLHKKHLNVVRSLNAHISKNNQGPESVSIQDFQLTYHVENLCSLQSLLPQAAYRSDSTCIHQILKQHYNVVRRKLPKTVGGYLSLYGRAPSNVYYIFD